MLLISWNQLPGETFKDLVEADTEWISDVCMKYKNLLDRLS